MTSHKSHVNAQQGAGLWKRISSLLHRSDAESQRKPGKFIKVWDAQRDAYRMVDLRDNNDALWSVAIELAKVQARQQRRPAA